MRPTIAPEDVLTVMREAAGSNHDAVILSVLCRHVALAMNDIEGMRIIRARLEKIARKRGAE